MSLMHIVDYVHSGNEGMILNTAKLCVVVKEDFIGKYEQVFTIRRIHHLGYKVWLGKEEKIKSFAYDKADENGGARSILTINNEFLVPRCKENKFPTTRIALYNKLVYVIKKEKILVKELVLENNMPVLLDCEFQKSKYKYFEDVPKGIKGRFSNNVKKSGEEFIIF